MHIVRTKYAQNTLNLVLFIYKKDDDIKFKLEYFGLLNYNSSNIKIFRGMLFEVSSYNDVYDRFKMKEERIFLILCDIFLL